MNFKVTRVNKREKIIQVLIINLIILILGLVENWIFIRAAVFREYSHSMNFNPGD